jgi:3-methyladenine DNA glycosylase AlkD
MAINWMLKEIESRYSNPKRHRLEYRSSIKIEKDIHTQPLKS